jgi:hypothetical protein
MGHQAIRVVDRVQDLADVDWPVSDGQALVWDEAQGQFVGRSGTGGDLTYTHNQVAASASWVVAHNLGKYPSITVIDTAGSEVVGDVTHNSLNQATITFSAPFSGKAICN